VDNTPVLSDALIPLYRIKAFELTGLIVAVFENCDVERAMENGWTLYV
jgi:hypothetical protein